jgi:iron(III) transport system ATP-binding protein
MSLLKVESISCYQGQTQAVNNVSFIQEPKQKLAIAGATGSGKTSLLKMIAGLVQPSAGNIFLKNERVLGPLEQLLPGHKSIAYLSQHFELLNNYWVYEILEMSNQLSTEAADAIYALCQIEHLLKRRTNQLSGGERQRVALAKTLCKQPSLLLLDEPFSNLDSIHRQTIKQVLHDVCDNLQITCTIVAHDAQDVLSWADEIIVLEQGSTIQKGTPQELYFKPINKYVGGLFGNFNLLRKEWLTDAIYTHMVDDDWFVRPNMITFCSDKEAQLNGTLVASTFMGNYFVHEVRVFNQSILIYTLQPIANPINSLVYIKLL